MYNAIYVYDYILLLYYIHAWHRNEKARFAIRLLLLYIIDTQLLIAGEKDKSLLSQNGD